MLFKGIILTAIERLNGARSVSSVYHLLTGSKNVQTLQDAYIFSNYNFYGVYKGLDRDVFEHTIQELLTREFLVERLDEKERRIVTCTEKAVNWVRENECRLPLHYYHGMQYAEVAQVFYNRLLLTIQTLTNTRESHFSFIPVINDREVEAVARRIYKEYKGKELDYLTALLHELEQLLDNLPSDEANIFVDRFSGFRHYGKSVDQLAVGYRREKEDIRLLLLGIIHHSLHQVEQQKEEYQALYRLYADLKKPVKLAGSTGRTYELYLNGLSPEEIASSRRLKLNTVYDHLVEIALHDPSFPFSSFVSDEDAREILAAIAETNSNKLKEIKERVRNEISYFQIRLMFVFQHKFRGGGDHLA